jgi:hypothetical protein
VYDVELGSILINYVIQLLKMVYHIRWISDGYPKPDGHGYGYEFLPMDIIAGGYYLWPWIWLRVDIFNIRSESDPLPSLPSSHIHIVYAMNTSRQKEDINMDQRKAKYSRWGTSLIDRSIEARSDMKTSQRPSTEHPISHKSNKLQDLTRYGRSCTRPQRQKCMLTSKA